MHELYEDLEEICETLADELAKTNAKLEKAGGELSAGDVDYINKLTHAIKSVKTTKAMMDADDDYNRQGDMMGGNRNGQSYRRNGMDRQSYRGSYARGRGRNARRDSMGRYSSDNDEMIMELRELMEDAPDEKTRMEFERFIKKVEQM